MKKQIHIISWLSLSVRRLMLSVALAACPIQTGLAQFSNLSSPTPETPGAIVLNTTGVTGTVLATRDSPFAATYGVPPAIAGAPGSGDTLVALCYRNLSIYVPSYLVTRYVARGATVGQCPVFGDPPPAFSIFTGILRSSVVDRGGGLLDFHYQLVNTSPSPSDIVTQFFRIKTIGGFSPNLTIAVGQVGGAGLKPVATADRDEGNLGGVGFAFPPQPPQPFVGHVSNIGPGETSAIVIVRTNATQYGDAQMAISGGGTALASTFVASFPEIAVEQPLNTDIPDGGSKSFGSVIVGANTNLTFTIRNTGTFDLSVPGITKDGTDAAMFTITSSPATVVSGPAGSTTFSVRFSPTSTGAKTAAIHIANNDFDENPFDITLSGAGTSPNDSDGDGLLDSWELTYWPTTAGHSATDDFDKDGILELLEEAFGLNPTVPDFAGLPLAVNEGGYLTMTITKHAGVTYEVQSAGTLLSGAPDSFSASTTTLLINNVTTLKVRDNIPYGTPPDRFMRVKVTAAP